MEWRKNIINFLFIFNKCCYKYFDKYKYCAFTLLKMQMYYKAMQLIDHAQFFIDARMQTIGRNSLLAMRFFSRPDDKYCFFLIGINYVRLLDEA